ncbi:MAG: isoprenylcysteine carboxylmethyltransferase family protein [Planctomycetes bacterium]|nr:isoprenylcysteine carboxylmethyltransferase family protein [Planctomycetota bacterium]
MEETGQQVGTGLTGKLIAWAGARYLLLLGVWSGLLFGAAGSLAWMRAWICLGLWIVTVSVNIVVLLRKNPAVLVARMGKQRFDAKFDKVLVPLLRGAALVIPILAGLDAVRYQWSSLPFWSIGPGLALHLAGDALLLATLIVNPYLAKEVRVQTERGHRVISTGPYAYVRHPMYAGIFLLLASLPLVLGSWWILVPGCVIVVLFIVRTAFEDRMLRESLPGYDEYSKKTCYRLVPGIW